MQRRVRKSVYLIACCVAATMSMGAGSAHAQLNLPPVIPDRLPTDDIGRRVDDVRERTRRTREAAIDESLAEVLAMPVSVADGVLRTFEPALDPDGAAIEAQTIVVLVQTDRINELRGIDVDVVTRRDLKSLGQTLLTLRNRGTHPLADVLHAVRALNPSVSADFNHIYSLQTDTETVPMPAADVASAATAINALRIGIIDSDVDPQHHSLSAVEVVRRDLAGQAGERPTTHGTAVASLIASGAPAHTAVYAASVFFQQPGKGPGATADGLVAALDWLASEEVDVINMSLAGPGNALLENAVRGLLDNGEVIVAAVGNNGPRGEPLYPAAYDGVIGVTAVDREHKIFRYANRGKHVDFAGVGVNVRVADSNTGAWRLESGTSIASPRVAVIIASLLKQDGIAPEAVESWLLGIARDLGRRGHDKTFGHGLLTRRPQY